MASGIIAIPNHNDLVGLKANKNAIKINIDNVYAGVPDENNLTYYLKSEVDVLVSNLNNQILLLNNTIDALDARVQILENA